MRLEMGFQVTRVVELPVEDAGAWLEALTQEFRVSSDLFLFHPVKQVRELDEIVSFQRWNVVEGSMNLLKRKCLGRFPAQVRGEGMRKVMAQEKTGYTNSVQFTIVRIKIGYEVFFR